MGIPSSIRYALRSLQRSRGFAALFVLTLALGLAGVSTIFSIVNSVILRPLPFPHPERLVTISQRSSLLGNGPQVCTLAEFLAWQKSGLLDYEAAIGTRNLTLTGKDRASLLYGAQVTPDFFRVFGIQPILGRGFVQKDAITGDDQVMVLSHELWASRFGGDPAIVGKRITFSGATMTIIGVMPPRFAFPRLAEVGSIMHWAPEQSEFWTPLSITKELIDQGNYNYFVLGRLRASIAPRRAAAEFRTVAVGTYRDFAQKDPAVRDIIERFTKSLAIDISPLDESMASGVHDALWMLLAAVVLLLLLVLFNLGNLLVTRHANRIREYAVRRALGATLWQIARQTLIEQGILVAISSGLSVFLSGWAMELIRKDGAGRLPRLYEMSLDAHTILLLIALAIVIALIFGVLPLFVLPDTAAHFSLRSARGTDARRQTTKELLRSLGGVLDPAPVLRAFSNSESRSATGDRQTQRLRAVLIAAEIAFSMVLLVGAGLLTASFRNVLNVEPGFDPHNLLTFSASLNPKISSDPAKALVLRREMLARIRALPGVESATVVNVLPLAGDYELHAVRAVGRPFLESAARAEYRVIDSGYFRAMHIPLLAGRVFRDNDSAKLVIINQKMAERLWPGENAIGRQFTEGDNPPVTVIGIVGNVHGSALEAEPIMQYYSPLVSHPTWADSFAVRSKNDSLGLLPTIEKTLWRLNPDQAVSGAATMQHIVEALTLERRLETGLLAGFSASALFLSALGLFGVASLSVARRAREFGIRMALGATSADVLQLEAVRNAVIVAWGLLAGFVLSLAIHRAFAGFLFGVSALNANIYAAAAIVLTLAAMLAVLIPAFRAARTDPAIALRDE